MRVAAYQAPLLPAGSMRALDLIRAQVRVCESAGIEILCCPEAVLGGLADDAPDPRAIAIRDDEELDRMLAPLASDRVAVIVGLTEIDAHARLFNTAAIFHGGRVRWAAIASGIRRSTGRSTRQATRSPCSRWAP